MMKMGLLLPKLRNFAAVLMIWTKEKVEWQSGCVLPLSL